MRLLNKYLFSTLSHTFFPIFLTLYIITSIIFLVKMAALTSVIQMNFLELMQLYSYSMPTILFYTLPISYFISMTLTVSKLSGEYEMIVITSFGLNPLKIIKLFLATTISISLLLLIISLGLIPKANALKEIFINDKKQEAQFNIKASEYGQRLGSWLIYINEEKDNKFYDITLLQLDNNKDTLTSAAYATMANHNNNLILKLQQGKSFIISDTLQQIDFEEMFLNSPGTKIRNIKSLNDIIAYWSDRKLDLKKSKSFTFNILISLFPLISLLFIIAIGYFNPRYNSNYTTFLSSTVIVIFVIIANQLSLRYPNTSLYTFPILWILISYIYYSLTTKKLY
ncbi:MAG: LptF/LptG family permease [Arcobacteraceae bacterium]|nr:LptF/LptG family permease [Arcobacteraceae bacterium]